MNLFSHPEPRDSEVTRERPEARRNEEDERCWLDGCHRLRQEEEEEREDLCVDPAGICGSTKRSAVLLF